MACSDPQVGEIKANTDTTIKAPAELVSTQEVSLSPPNVSSMWQYKIEYLIKENSIVKKGDVIAKFDGQRIKNNLISRQSELAAVLKESEKQMLLAESQKQDLELALAEAQKNQEIASRKVEITDVSRSEIERQKQIAELKIANEVLAQAKQRIAQHQITSKANERVQAAKVNTSENRVAVLKSSLEKLTLRTPKEGIVLYIADGNNDKPAIGDTVYMGRALVSIPSLDKIAVKAEFDESYIAKIAVDQAVKIVLDAYPEKPFNGRIKDLGNTFREKSRRNPKVVFDAWIELDDLDVELMRPGMKAHIQVSTQQSASLDNTSISQKDNS